MEAVKSKRPFGCLKAAAWTKFPSNRWHAPVPRGQTMRARSIAGISDSELPKTIFGILTNVVLRIGSSKGSGGTNRGKRKNWFGSSKRWVDESDEPTVFDKLKCEESIELIGFENADTPVAVFYCEFPHKSPQRRGSFPREI